MENQDLNIELTTYQRIVEQEIENLRKENFSLKLVIAQLNANKAASELDKQPGEDLPHQSNNHSHSMMAAE